MESPADRFRMVTCQAGFHSNCPVVAHEGCTVQEMDLSCQLSSAKCHDMNFDINIDINGDINLMCDINQCSC